MKKSKLTLLLRALLFSGMILFLGLWIFGKSDQEPINEPKIENAYFQSQLKEVEQRLLKQFEEEEVQNLTVHTYDMEGNHLSSKTYLPAEQIVNVEHLYIASSEYLTTIHNDIYIIRDL